MDTFGGVLKDKLLRFFLVRIGSYFGLRVSDCGFLDPVFWTKEVFLSWLLNFGIHGSSSRGENGNQLITFSHRWCDAFFRH